MKNHRKITKITEIHQLWMAMDANQSIWIEGMSKIVSARFIRSWPGKKQIQWIQEDEIWIVRRKNNTERIRDILGDAGERLRDNISSGKYKLDSEGKLMVRADATSDLPLISTMSMPWSDGSKKEPIMPINPGSWYQINDGRYKYIINVIQVWNGSVYFSGIIDGRIGKASSSIRDFQNKYILLSDQRAAHLINQRMRDISRVEIKPDRKNMLGIDPKEVWPGLIIKAAADGIA